MTRKWETIKKSCADEAYTQVLNKSTGDVGSMIQMLRMRLMLDCDVLSYLSSNDLRKKLANMVYDAIVAWDARCFESLRQLYPKKFPKGNLVIELSENNSWLILPKLKN